MGFLLKTAPLNNGILDGSSISNGKIVASDLSLVTVAGGILLVSFVVVSESFGVDRLLAVVVDILPVADKLGPLVDKLELDILVVDKLIVVSLVHNEISVDIVWNLIDDSELRTGDWGFDINFPIVGYLNVNGSQFKYVLVYHNSSRYAFLVATVDWLMKMNVVNFGHD
ncbi:hypothetical protein G9A89_013069 [Geosiphon pyriformis]|nr:hypothetical protein G9A89_013069 [Geosiphon pyriformis]